MRAALMPRRRHRCVKATALTPSLRRFGRCRYYIPFDLNQLNTGNLNSLGDISAIRSGVSMRSGAFRPALLAALALAVTSASPAAAAIVVNIDKSTQSMIVTVDGTPRYIWPVSTGKPGYDTPSGVFRPNRMDADHLSQEWDNAPMPHTIFFDLHGHAIHGFLNTSHIGTAASHGCVRLAPQNATILYNLVEAQGMKDTTVIVSGRTPAGSNPEVARRAAAERQAAAGLPMEIAPGSAQPDVDQQPAPYGQQQQPTFFGQRLFGGPQPAPPAPQTGYYGQPSQPPAYRQPQQYYVRSSNGQLYYVQPGYQQQYARPYTQY